MVNSSTLPPVEAAPGRRAAPRSGYVVAAVVDAVLLFLLDVWPGWDVVPILSPAFADVLAAVNAAIVVNLVVHAVSALVPSPRVRALGQLLLCVVGVAVGLLLLRVYPFSVTGLWIALITALLWLGVVGSAVGGVVAAVQFVVGRDPKARRA